MAFTWTTGPTDAEPRPTSTQELRELALSHPRWAAATARGRAADGAIAEALSAQEGLVGIARRFRATETPRSKKRGKAERAYLRVCRETSTTPWPSDPDVFALHMQGFGAFYCARGGAPSTIDTYVGGILALARERGVLLGPWHARAIRHEAAQLGADFPHQTVRSASVTLAQRRGLALHIGGSAKGPDDRYALMWMALATLPGALMTRISEILDSALRWKRVRIVDGQLALHLPWRKNSKMQYSVAHDTFVVPALPPPLDALTAMQRYAAACGEVIGRGDTPVFPRRDPDGTVAPGLLLNSFNREFRAWWEAAGLPPAAPHERRSSHGLGRRGGLNAYRGAGATPQQVGQVGGWSTLEGMEPYDESGPTTSRALSVLVAEQSALAVAADVDRGGGGAQGAALIVTG